MSQGLTGLAGAIEILKDRYGVKKVTGPTQDGYCCVHFPYLSGDQDVTGLWLSGSQITDIVRNPKLFPDVGSIFSRFSKLK
jgi:hypothetical protein